MSSQAAGCWHHFGTQASGTHTCIVLPGSLDLGDRVWQWSGNDAFGLLFVEFDLHDVTKLIKLFACKSDQPPHN